MEGIQIGEITPLIFCPNDLSGALDRGPDGLDPECLASVNARWSLSPLTFPHFLVRILVAEQVYRAVSLLQNHPYHRA